MSRCKQPRRIALETAVRAYVPRTRERKERPAPGGPAPVLVIDTETLTDRSQALLFGSYRAYDRRGRLRVEGLIAADDLTPEQREVLVAYRRTHAADNGTELELVSRAQFLDRVFWPMAYKAHAIVVGHNLPFDLSRLAIGWRAGRDGGFSLLMWPGLERDGRHIVHQYRPEISIKAYGPKRAFIRFTTQPRIDAVNLVAGRAYRGRFVDTHRLAFALADRSLSLDGAAAAFGLEGRKDVVERHGELTEAYIDYNRQDVRLTYQLYLALVEELGRHPIDVTPETAASPAAIAKGYLRAIGIVPRLERDNCVSDRALGAAMTAYYGGRAETRIRRSPMPVRYADFMSMYPTVFALLGLWRFVIAERLVERDTTEAARALLGSITREALLDPAMWPALAGIFCRISPADDLLPVRARYGGRHGPWTIGLNHFTSTTERWYALADLVDARILSGKAPEILEAIAIVQEGVLPGLVPVSLRGEIAVQPGEDLFRRAIEERQRVKKSDPRLAGFLKTLANAGAYGIFAEYHRLEPVAGGAEVEAHGLWPIATRVTAPEEPGEFCYPALAATITAAARLLLGVLQAGIEERGGTYVACDTDSLLIVASESGGVIACPGGPLRMPDGRPAVKALSWAEVDEVLAELDRLNPYGGPGRPPLVKLEDENFALVGRGADGKPIVARDRPIELRAVAVSAKRYALYERAGDDILIRKPSSHGLGLYRSPAPNDGPGAGPAEVLVNYVWRSIVLDLEGLPAEPRPAWLDLPAVGHLPISSPGVLRAFRGANEGLSYRDGTKPFGFLLIGHIDPLTPNPEGHGLGPVVPIAPYSTDLAETLDLPWVDRRSGEGIAVTTARRRPRGMVRLQTLGDVIDGYRHHPEQKSGSQTGGRGDRSSVGLLPRLHILAGVPVHIGKESNDLEVEEEGALTQRDEPYVEYRDERREWEAALPALRRLRQERGWRYLAKASGLSERALRDALNLGRVPHRAARHALLSCIADELRDATPS